MDILPIVHAAAACNVCLKDKEDSAGFNAFMGEGKNDVLVIGQDAKHASLVKMMEYMRLILPSYKFDYTYRIRCELNDMLDELFTKDVITACNVYTNLMVKNYKLVLTIDTFVDAFTDPEMTTHGVKAISIPFSYDSEQTALAKVIDFVLNGEEKDDTR